MSGVKHIIGHFLGFFEGTDPFLTPKLSYMPRYMFCLRKINILLHIQNQLKNISGSMRMKDLSIDVTYAPVNFCWTVPLIVKLVKLDELDTE